MSADIWKMPDRIWAERDADTNEKRWFTTRGMGAEYVRADLHETEIARLRDELAKAKCDPDGCKAHIDAFMERLAKAESTLASVTAERDAMREAIDEIARQKLPIEMWAEYGPDYDPDFEGGYEGCVRRARAAQPKPQQKDTNNV